ncbi:MAG: GNAT family N-acetyltransferase [Alicyclobacillus sp.]|nr:GNAT family N-acetyltransferase [Alicyclobacillus sp.]
MNQEPRVRLVTPGARTLKTLWQLGHADPYWPIPDCSQDGMARWVNTWRAASLCGWGGLWTAWYNRQVIGMVTLSRVEPALLGNLEGVWEGGTFLLPAQRGRGLNLPVKQAMLRRAFASRQARWLVLAISADNLRALAALTRLPWPWQREDGTGPFARLQRYKSWQTGKPMVVFALARAHWLATDDMQH